MKSPEFDEIVRSVVSELKRTGDLHWFEDDVQKAVSQSVQLGDVLSGAPTEVQIKRKRAEVQIEISKRLSNFSQLERKIQSTLDATWIREMVDDCVHSTARKLVMGSSNDDKGKEEAVAYNPAYDPDTGSLPPGKRHRDEQND